MGDGIYFGFTPLWVTLLSAAPYALLVSVWLVAVAIVSRKGDDVDKPNRIAQLYGYTICLVALVVAIISVASLLSACFDRANPLQSEYGYGVTLSSFEAYQATFQRERGVYPPGANAPSDTASTATLRQRYDALVADRIATTRYRTSKTLVTYSALLLIAAGLFAFHWRWVRRLANGGAAV